MLGDRVLTIETSEPQGTLSPVFLAMFGFGKSEKELADGATRVYSIFALTSPTDHVRGAVSLTGEISKGGVQSGRSRLRGDGRRTPCEAGGDTAAEAV